MSIGTERRPSKFGPKRTQFGAWRPRKNQLGGLAVNRDNERLTERAISVQWQEMLQQRGMMLHGCCASLEHGSVGRVLRLRNGEKSADLPITLMHLEMPMDQFVASILAPAIGSLA